MKRICLAIVFILGYSLPAATVHVANSTQLAVAIGNISPGDTVIMADGIYTHEGLTIRGIHATPATPVLIKAQNTGGVQWKGFLHICDSAYITIDGIVFNQAIASLPSHDVYVHIKESHHCRVTRCTLDLDETALSKDDTRFWLFLEAGESNEIDYCRFNDKITKHAPLKVIYNEYAPLIRHNYFPLHSSAEGSNGYETLQLGSGSTGNHMRDMHAMIEYNLFEDCDGEAEIISVKTSSNTLRFNTFSDCKGKVVLRMADNCAVYNNYFLNPSGKSRVGGIRIHGSRNDVYNNYFEGLTANVFETWPGDTAVSPGNEEVNYRQSKDNRILFNTAHNCKSHVLYFRKTNGQYLLPSEGWKIMNNLFVVAGTNMVGGTGDTGTVYENNVVYGTGAGGVPDIGRILALNQIRVADPLLVRHADGIWRQQPASPTIGHASPIPGLAYRNDLDGQPRDSTPDVGADEYSEAPIVHHPLAPGDVGPFAY